MSIVIDKRQAAAESRLVLVALLGLNLRLMENWRTLQVELTGKCLDYEATMIMMAIVSIGGSKLLRMELRSDLHDLANPLGLELLTKVNLSSIASATALNRETVRRRVQDLEVMGLVARDDKDGVRIARGVLQEPVVRDALNLQLAALRQAINQLARHGVLSSAV